MIFKTLITARGASKSIPQKNIVNLKDKPLIAYSIIASINSCADATWVSTEDKKIKEVSLEWGANVIDRPPEYATDKILNEPSLIQFAKQENFDWIIFIQPTGPFIKAEYINEGIRMIKTGKFDSVFTATKKHWVPTWTEEVKPISWDIANRPRRQDRDEYYEENGMFYITSKERLLNTGLRYGGNIGIIKVPLCDSFQVDSIEDLELIEKIIS